MSTLSSARRTLSGVGDVRGRGLDAGMPNSVHVARDGDDVVILGEHRHERTSDHACCSEDGDSHVCDSASR